ncbi:MAG: hypothetical protein ACOC93_06395, partial [Planctomycetota bacterium]
MVKQQGQLTLLLLAASDLLVAIAAWGGAYAIRLLGGEVGWTPYPDFPIMDYLPAILLSLVVVVAVMSRSDLYGSKRTRSLLGELGSVARAVVTTWALTYVVVSFVKHPTVSRLMMGSLLAVWLPLAMANRLAVRSVLRYLRKRGWNQRTAAIIGNGRLAQKLCHTMRRNIWSGICPRYFVTDGSPSGQLMG